LPPTAPGPLASRVNQLLDVLSGELTLVNSPHVTARRSLGISGQYGWTKRPYGREAFRIWEEAHRQDPEDVETMHHLAIMHHARAFDLESGREPSKSDVDWEAAMGYWHRLWKGEAFWDRLAVQLGKAGRQDKVVEGVRASWPVGLLQVHFEIAFDPATQRQQRIGYHVKLMLNSPFPQEAKEEVRQRVYGRWVSSVDPQVWQNDVRTPEIIKDGTDAIEGYLERDPGCVYALADLLRLQHRLLWARHEQVNSLDEQDPQREELIRMICEEAPRWGPFLQQLLERVEGLDLDVRQKLCFWYHAMGAVHRVAKRYREAGAFFERARQAAADEEGRRRQEDLVGEALALEARELAVSHDPEDETKAKRMADRVCERDRLSVRAHRFLANAYMLVREYDRAQELCQRGLELEPDLTDLSALDDVTREKADMRDLLESISTNRRKHEARELLESVPEDLRAGREAEACEKLDRILELDPEASPAYFLRCQCHVALVHPQEAQSDLETFRRLAAEEGPEAVEAARNLEKECAKLTDEVSQYGEEGFRLRRSAVQAFNDDQYDDAETALRRAIELAPTSRGKTSLRNELANVLSTRAGHDVNHVMKSQRSARRTKEQVCAKAVKWLEEAAQLCPKDPQIRSNLQNLREVMQELKDALEREEEFGGAEALTLQQEAVRAYNEDRYDDAIDHLRRAISTSRRPDRLKKELSKALTTAAVSMVNEMKGEPRTSVLEEANALLTEALQLDSGNSRARENAERLRELLSSAQQVESLAMEFGGPQAMELRMKAVKAFNDDRHEEAISLLRAAIGASRSTGKLEKELSEVLAAAAVAKVNAEGVSGSRSELRRAKTWLEEAVQLDPGNQHAMMNLTILERLL